MNIEKQKIVISILKTGFYEVDCVNALVYSIRKRGRTLLKAAQLSSKYRQIMLFKGRGTGIKAIVYLHELVYIAWHGFYDPSFDVCHEDNNNENNSIYNLMARTKAQNKANSPASYYPTELRLIRSPEIAKIRQLHSVGNSQASIAKQLELNRLSVRYIIKRIESGQPLRYE